MLEKYPTGNYVSQHGLPGTANEYGNEKKIKGLI
jgi:hypothetical protein